MKKLPGFVCWVILLALLTNVATAQDSFVLNGLVVDPNQRPLADVQVSIDQSDFATSDDEGRFTIYSDKDLSKPTAVIAERENYVLQNWGMTGSREITILMDPKPIELTGQVVDSKGQAVSNAIITVGGLGAFASTDLSGRFKLELPVNSNLKGRFRFFVDDKLITPDRMDLDPDQQTVKLTLDAEVIRQQPRSVALDEDLADPPPSPSVEDDSLRVPEDELSELEEARSDLAEEFPGVKPTLVVVVYEDNVDPVGNARVEVNGAQYTTNERGETRIFADSVNTAIFSVEGHVVARKIYDFEENYVFLHLIDTATTAALDLDPVVSVDQNFKYLFNQLESDKQQLQANGSRIRLEIEKIIQKLDKGVSPEEEAILSEYLKRLEGSLVENELAYENTLAKTDQILERMRTRIIESKVTQERQKAEVESQRTQRNISVVITLFAIALLGVSFFAIYKTRAKNKELAIAYDQLKQSQDAVTKSSSELDVLKNIGQTLTTHLDFEHYMLPLSQAIGSIIPHDYFGIGLFDPDAQVVEYTNSVVDGELAPRKEVSVFDNQSLTTWCLLNARDVIINNIRVERANYIDQNLHQKEGKYASLLFLPLLIEEKSVGVLTIRSKKRDAYTDTKIGLLKTLASYAAIAALSKLTYLQLKHKTVSIDNSLDYVHKIQQDKLPTPTLFTEVFKDHFRLYRPKASISGDFYWAHKEAIADGEVSYYAVGDCTGHAIPGALLTVLASEVLTRCSNGHTTLPEFLEAVQFQFDQLFEPSEQPEPQFRGVDLALLKQTKYHNGTCEYAYLGARRPLYHAKADQEIVTMIEGDRHPIRIGGHRSDTRNYTEHELVCEKGDVLYLTSDGYMDQQNHLKQKIGEQHLTEIFREIMLLDADLQKEHLERDLDNFKGDIEQRDDITIIGLVV